MVQDWLSIYGKLVAFLKKKDPSKSFKFTGDDSKVFTKLEDELRRYFVYNEVGEELPIALEWVKNLKKALKQAREVLGLQGEQLSREFRSFMEDPIRHLMKKIVFYLYDLLREKIHLEEFIQTAGAAVRTSLKTNMRSVYQNWVYINILTLLGEMNGVMVYPEVKYLLLGRSGKQKTGLIPPNAIIYLTGRGYLSFFLEAPRPISWEDSTDLRKIWTLYTALRPDMIVYTRKILNIVKLTSNPPIERPNIIIECKELDDWYKRGREVRGPLAKPLSVEEWRSKWITGLWDGLADVLGVSRKEVVEEVKQKKVMRLKDIQIVTLYYTLYKPDKMFLVSRAKVPKEIKDYLRDRGLHIIDNVGFNKNKLKPLVNELYKRARRDSNDYEVIELNGEEIDLLERLTRILRRKNKYITNRDVIRFALEFTLRNKDRILSDEVYKLRSL